MRRCVPLLALLAACSEPTPGFEVASCDHVEACVEVPADAPQLLLDTVNTLADGTTVVLGAGTFELDNQVTIRADGISLVGQGIDATVLDFSAQAAQTNGVDAVGQDLLFEDFTIVDAKKDGIRVEDSARVTFRRIKVDWSAGPDAGNGAYGIYPVKSSQVLVEQSEARHASDAGLYVGQCRHVVVRDNVAAENVAGLEIENTEYADVHDNTVEHNTGGLLVFDLPGNPIVGHDIVIRDNVVRANDMPSFAPSGVVAQIPTGTGTFLLASRRVEVTGNTYEDNGTTDIAVLHGTTIAPDLAKWRIERADLVGDADGLNLQTDATGLWNDRSSEIWVHGNTHANTGTSVDGGSPDLDARPLGFLVDVLYGDTPVDPLLSVFLAGHGDTYDAHDPAGNTNTLHLCFGDEGGAAFASLDIETLATRLENLDVPTLDDVFRPAAPYAPFDCTGFTGGPIDTEEDVEGTARR
jgi:parallel beta-helix repeat protein